MLQLIDIVGLVVVSSGVWQATYSDYNAGKCLASVFGLKSYQIE